MARFIKDLKESQGKAPGSLVLIGNQKMDKAEIDVMKYDAHDLIEKQNISIQDAIAGIDKSNVSWINVYGIHDLDFMREMGEVFTLHPLLLEDILNTDHYPKYEELDDKYVFIIKMLEYDKDSRTIMAEQITLILGDYYVLTFQEKHGDIFDQLRDRIRQKKGRVRLNHCDYLIYAVMDSIVDNYMLIIESIGREIENLEDKIHIDQSHAVVEEIYNHKTELNFLRKAVRPLKEILMQVLKSENPFMQENNVQYLKDLNDHVIQVADTLELYYNLLSDQLNAYNSNMSNRMNDIMKVLTIFAAIFIPLTFVAGIYGMNFEHIPEIKYKYAYPIFWLGVISIASGLLIYFKRRKWL